MPPAYPITPSLVMKTPTLFVNHGGGPLPLMGRDPIISSELSAVPSRLPTRPSAILVISAHWEANPLEISAQETNSLYFDYGNFGPGSLDFKYPAPGSPDLAKRVQALLAGASLPAKMRERNLDHGAFVTLLLAYPAADIPVVALSLSSTLSPSTHLNIGRALAPLRDENVLILGSGMSFHNFGAFNPRWKGKGELAGAKFDTALIDAVTHQDAAKRDALLEQWELLPGARHAHPREDHLLPLLVVAGAAGEDRGLALTSGAVMGVACSSFGFGVPKELANNN